MPRRQTGEVFMGWTIRDAVWLVVLLVVSVAMGCAWWVDRSQIKKESWQLVEEQIARTFQAREVTQLLEAELQKEEGIFARWTGSEWQLKHVGKIGVEADQSAPEKAN
jgi:hypothetical protein